MEKMIPLVLIPNTPRHNLTINLDRCPCNVSYKCIFNVVADRLKYFLNEFVSHCQATLVLRRNIIVKTSSLRLS